MSAVKVSVCIPTYNGAEFVAKAIESVLAQTFADFELVVVDDSSDDTTVDIVRSFTDPRIRICQNEKRLGIPGNWNRCLSLAQGEYICLFHQDDVMLPENLERKVRLLASDTAISLVHSAAEFLMEDSAPAPLPNWIEGASTDFVVEGVVYFHKLLLGNLICAPAVVACRQRLLDLGGFNEELGFTPDYEMWLKVCVEGRVAFLSQPLIKYRWHGKNASHVYQFERGAEETFLARHHAVQYYVERTERQEEGEIMLSAISVIAKSERHAMQLGQYIEGQQAYIEELEQARDKLWVDVQQVGRSWEEQKVYIESRQAHIESQQAHIESQQAHIESQQVYIRQVERERDRLEAERARMLSQRLRRLARNVWRRAHSR